MNRSVMAQNTYEEKLEIQLKEIVEAHGKQIQDCINYLSIIQLYYKRIQQSETVEEAKEWADRMIEHALQVK